MRTDGRTSSRVLSVRHPLALGRYNAVNSDCYLACEPAVRQAFHTGAGATSGLQAVGDRHRTPAPRSRIQQAQAVAAGSQLTPVAQGTLADHVVGRIAQVSERARMDRLGELSAASQDVLIEVVWTLEEQLWTLRVQLGGRD